MNKKTRESSDPVVVTSSKAVQACAGREKLETLLPRWSIARGLGRRVITWATGVPAAGEVIAPKSQVNRIAVAIVTFVGGTVLGMAAVPMFGAEGVMALPLAWTLAVGAARDLQLTIYHHAAHRSVISEAWSRRIGCSIATALLIEPFDSYAEKHCRIHHGRHTVSTDVDPTVTFLRKIIGIEPGASVETNRRRFFRSLLSPRVHIRMLTNRMKSQFALEATWSSRLTTGAYLGAVGAVGVGLSGPTGFFLGFVLPLTLGYQGAQIARLMVEHRWPEHAAANCKRTPTGHDELTIAIRCAVAPPELWTVKTVAKFVGQTLANFWIRFVVLPGDSGPAHSWHHGRARGDWVNYIAAASQWTQAREREGLPRIEEAWGYGEALAKSLASFEKAAPESIAAPVLLGSRADRRKSL